MFNKGTRTEHYNYYLFRVMFIWQNPIHLIPLVWLFVTKFIHRNSISLRHKIFRIYSWKSPITKAWESHISIKGVNLMTFDQFSNLNFLNGILISIIFVTTTQTSLLQRIYLIIKRLLVWYSASEFEIFLFEQISSSNQFYRIL